MSGLRDCTMAPLVEASFDARLGANDVASVERHLTTCASCGSLWRELQRLRELACEPVAPEPPLLRRRARVRLLREAAMGVLPRHPRRAPGVAILAAAIALLGSWIVWASAAPGLPASLERGAMAALTTRAKLTLLGPNAELRRTSEGATEIVELTRGAIQLWVRPLSTSQRLLVRTSDAEVEVRGTIFRVEADQDGRLLHVEVVQGHVEVRRGEEHVLLSIGEQWLAPFDGSRSPLNIAAADAGERKGTLPSPAEGRPHGPFAKTATPRAAPLVAPSASAVSAAPVASSSVCASPAKATFGGAVALVDSGAYGAAVEQLSAFADAHPDDARREDARFLVIVALERAGRFDAAVAAARKYLAEFPTGARRSEASAVLAAYGTRDGG